MVGDGDGRLLSSELLQKALPVKGHLLRYIKTTLLGQLWQFFLY
jgi:hypothetical protein